MHLNKSDVTRKFYQWVYNPYNTLKFKPESLCAVYTLTTVTLMQQWYNHVSPASFAQYMENTYGHPYHNSKSIAKEIIAKKKLEELLNG